MTNARHLFAALLMAVCLAGCKTVQHTDVYEFNAQVLAMPSCFAKMEKFCTCYALFADNTGRKFYIGSPGASPDVQYFIASLEEGKGYYLPDAFMEFLKKKTIKSKPGDGRDTVTVQAMLNKYIPHVMHDDYSDGRWATFDAVAFTILAPPEWQGTNLVVYCTPGKVNPLFRKSGARCSFSIQRGYLAGAANQQVFDGALENVKKIK